jgi:hypothetical protein
MINFLSLAFKWIITKTNKNAAHHTEVDHVLDIFIKNIYKKKLHQTLREKTYKQKKSI